MSPRELQTRLAFCCVSDVFLVHTFDSSPNSTCCWIWADPWSSTGDCFSCCALQHCMELPQLTNDPKRDLYIYKLLINKSRTVNPMNRFYNPNGRCIYQKSKFREELRKIWSPIPARFSSSHNLQQAQCFRECRHTTGKAQSRKSRSRCKSLSLGGLCWDLY